jgi:nucleoside-diphosphate-sugar epimerase
VQNRVARSDRVRHQRVYARLRRAVGAAAILRTRSAGAAPLHTLRSGFAESIWQPHARATMTRLFERIFVTGGAGYCGSRLVPQLLSHGYKVTVYDIMYFGDHFLPKDPNLQVIAADIRNTARLAAAVAGHDAFVSLACISNDASFELDERLSTSINYDAFEPMALAAKNAGVKRFVYASSSSVYGVSDQPDVTEDHPLLPLTLYNEYKALCEPLLAKHIDDRFVGVTFRPATVCGFAPRQRLDLSVNILTNHAVTNNKITVFGGSQLRPNLHIQDYVDAVELLLTAPSDKIKGDIFNVGYQNMSIMEIAELVREVVREEFPERKPIEIVTTPTDDIRSYHINSDKVRRVLGYQPRHTIADAVRELCTAFRDGKLPNSMHDDFYFNVRRLKRLKAA